MTTRLPNAVGVWRESPGAGLSVALAHLYWAFDVATSTWTMTSDRSQEAGRLVDVTGTDVFVLTTIDTISLDAETLVLAQRPDGTVLTY